jgi:hypothetical protein
VTVISGSFVIETGEKMEEIKGTALRGDLLKCPKGCRTLLPFQEIVIQVHGQGPQGITYVNPPTIRGSRIGI